MFGFFKNEEKKEEIREEIKYIADNFCKFKFLNEDKKGNFQGRLYYDSLAFGYKKINTGFYRNLYKTKILIHKDSSLSLFVFNDNLKERLKFCLKEIEYWSRDNTYCEHKDIRMQGLSYEEASIIERIEIKIELSSHEEKFLYNAFEPKILEIKQQIEKENIKKIHIEEEMRKRGEEEELLLEQKLLKSIKFKGKKC